MSFCLRRGTPNERQRQSIQVLETVSDVIFLGERRVIALASPPVGPPHPRLGGNILIVSAYGKELRVFLSGFMGCSASRSQRFFQIPDPSAAGSSVRLIKRFSLITSNTPQTPWTNSPSSKTSPARMRASAAARLSLMSTTPARLKPPTGGFSRSRAATRTILTSCHRSGKSNRLTQKNHRNSCVKDSVASASTSSIADTSQQL